MKNLFLLTIVVISMALTACTGGGSGDGAYTHQQLANNFVYHLNYGSDYDVELVKTNTQQWDFIVVYDYDLDTYDAYDLTYYSFNKDIDFFIYKYENHFHYDLDYIGNNEYKDRYTGITFTKSKISSADQTKAHEIIDNIKVKKAITQLTVQFGLSPQRAKTIAAQGLQLHKNMSQMTVYNYDQYSKAILGSTITDIQTAVHSYISGNSKALDEVYEKAAKVNNISKAQIKSLTNLFIKN